MKDIKRFIDHLECPIVDGIIFSDNRIQILEVESTSERPYEYFITPSLSTTIENLEAKGELDISYCASVGGCMDAVTGIKVVCGEASWGSDGFIAVFEMMTQDLLWMAFFTESNPFHKVTVANGYIVATSTLNCIWKFDIKNPTNVSVKCLDTPY